MYLQCISVGDGQTSRKFWLTSIDRRRCSKEAKTRNPLKFAGVPRTGKLISAVSRQVHHIVRVYGGDIAV